MMECRKDIFPRKLIYSPIGINHIYKLIYFFLQEIRGTSSAYNTSGKDYFEFLCIFFRAVLNTDRYILAIESERKNFDDF